jgi:hypothetical protein
MFAISTRRKKALQLYILSVLDALTQTDMLWCEPLCSLWDINMPQFARQMSKTKKYKKILPPHRDKYYALNFHFKANIFERLFKFSFN